MAARKTDNPQRYCPICGEWPLGAGNTVALVQYLHALELAERGVYVDGADAAQLYGDHYAGPGFLLSGAGALAASIDIAVGRIGVAARDRVFAPATALDDDDPVCVVVARRSALRSSVDTVLRRR